MASARDMRDALMVMGMRANELRNLGRSHSEAIADVRREYIDAGNDQGLVWHGAGYATDWAACGFPLVEPSHRLAASLMSTSVPAEHAEEFLAMPWRSFAFVVPSGLILDEPCLALAGRAADGRVGMMSFATGMQIGTEPSLVDWNRIAFVNADGDWTDIDVDRAEREALMFGRLLVGLCAELTAHRPAAPISTQAGKRSGRQREDSLPKIFKLTRNVSVDVRQSIRDFIDGRAAKGPTLRVLVRGHWRLQPCGAGSESRKMIQIEPYWRGDEGAPVAVRSHIVDNR